MKGEAAKCAFLIASSGHVDSDSLHEVVRSVGPGMLRRKTVAVAGLLPCPWLRLMKSLPLVGLHYAQCLFPPDVIIVLLLPTCWRAMRCARS